jgi:hypothetical protein
MSDQRRLHLLSQSELGIDAIAGGTAHFSSNFAENQAIHQGRYGHDAATMTTEPIHAAQHDQSLSARVQARRAQLDAARRDEGVNLQDEPPGLVAPGTHAPVGKSKRRQELLSRTALGRSILLAEQGPPVKQTTEAQRVHEPERLRLRSER